MHYSDDRTLFWRFGTPHITETFSQHYGGGRGSGHYGTGLYAYDSATQLLDKYEDRLQKIAEYRDVAAKTDPSIKLITIHPDPKTTTVIDRDTIEHMIYCKLDVSALRFYKPRDLNALNDFAKALTNFVWNLESRRDRPISFTSMKEMSNDYTKIIAFAERLNRIDDDQLNIQPHHIENAIESTLQCLKDKGIEKCSLPVNHVLNKYGGYDGVHPHPEYGDRNHDGNVIFRESLKKLFDLSIDIPIEDLTSKHNLAHSCAFNPASDVDRRYEQIDQYLAEEQRDPYIKLQQTIEPVFRKDFLDMLQQMLTQPNMVCQKSACKMVAKPWTNAQKIQKVRTVQQSCNRWSDDSNQVTHCQQLAEYWIEEVTKKKSAKL